MNSTAETAENEPEVETAPERGPRLGPLALFILICVAARVFLVAEIPSTFRNLIVDDLLYATMADDIAAGDWLGPYDERTFVKSCGFPIFLAAMMKAGIPLRLAQESLWAIACLVLVWSGRRVGVPRLVAGITFFYAYFSPAAFAGSFTRVLREGVYGSIVLCVAGLAIALLSSLAIWKRMLIALGLGVAMAALWHLREEGIWVLPPLAIAAVGLVWLERRRSSSWMKALVVLVIFALPAVLGPIASWEWLRRKNEQVYGEAITLEVKEPEFKAALGAIMRVKPDRRYRYEPISKETLEKLYQVSPSLASLRGYLDGPTYRSNWMVGENGGRVINATSFLIRKGAAIEGHYRDPTTAKAFYAKMAKEINDACDHGDLPADERRDSVHPALGSERWSDLRAGLERAASDLWELRLDSVRDKPRLPIVDVSPEDHERYLRVVGESKSPDLDGLLFRTELLRGIGSVTRWSMPWLAIGGALGLLIQLAYLRKRGAEALLWAQLILLTLCAARVLVVALLGTLLFPTGSTYLLPAFPVFAVACVLGIHGGIKVLRGARCQGARTSRHMNLVHCLLLMATVGSGGYLLHRKVSTESQRIIRTSAYAIADRDALDLIAFGRDLTVDLAATPALSVGSDSGRINLNFHVVNRQRVRPEEIVVRGRLVSSVTRKFAVTVRGQGKGWSGLRKLEFDAEPGGRFQWTLSLAARRLDEIGVSANVSADTRLIIDEIVARPAR